jgi:hypothetical protein
MAARGFLGAGDLYIARYVGGVLQAYQGPYECAKFEIKPNVDLKELVSKGRDTYGQVIESVAIPQPADLTVDLPEVNKESLAIAMLGTVAAISQTAGTLTDESVVVTDLDSWYALTKSALTGTAGGTLVVKNQAGSTTYVEGTDYIVERQSGMIKALVGGAIAAASTIKVTTPYASTTGNEIKGMTDAQLRARFKLVGKNFADNLPIEVTVYEAIIAADSAFDFLQDDFATISLPGRMKTPTGFTEPFIVRQRTT